LGSEVAIAQGRVGGKDEGEARMNEIEVEMRDHAVRTITKVSCLLGSIVKEVAKQRKYMYCAMGSMIAVGSVQYQLAFFFRLQPLALNVLVKIS
jgi:hypothetical protein